MWLSFFGFIFTLIVIYVIHKTLSQRKKTYVQYSKPGVWFVYYSKWMYHTVCIWLWQLQLPIMLNDYDPNAGSYDKCGLVPTPTEVKLERPKSLITDRHEDGILIWGGDASGRIVVAKVVRLSRRRASVMLMIKDKEGHLYTLPNQPDSNVINIENGQSWIGNGLLLECVEPMRTWRVKFNGILRKGVRDQYITEDADDNDDKGLESNGNESNIVHAKFDLLWKALKAPIDIWRDSSCWMIAKSLARESMVDYSSVKALDRDGYDQWGALHGPLKIGNDDLQTWYLRGGRQHRWGISDSSTNLQRSVNLFSYFANGNFLWVEGFSFNTGLSHITLGYVQTASGQYYPMTSTSLELSDLEGEDNLKNIFIECKAGGKQINLWNLLSDGMSVHSGDPWTLIHDIRPMYSASSSFGEGWGLAFMSKRFVGLCPVPEKESLSLPSVPDVIENYLVVSLSDKISSQVSLTGGKGASLSSLKYIQKQTENEELQFSVPNGVIVTSEAWKSQIEKSHEIKQGISFLEKAVASSHGSRITEACSKLQAIIEEVQICEEIFKSISCEMQKLFQDSLETKRFAVRSSACGEDSNEASSAGQNETILGCFWKDKNNQEPTSIIKALIRCWSSQFSFQSVEYRRQRGQLVNDNMAVVIQEMVPSKLAGVMFTRDPLTGSPSTIAITANYGLGESVVSGTAEPDTILVGRSWRNKLKIISKSVGEKKLKFIMKDGGGTTKIDVPSEDSKLICLNNDDALRVAKIGIYIEDYYGSPRDIEFAMAENKLYLLQARPLTFLDAWTEYELTHESDSGFLSDKEIHTIANAGEVFNGYICPLTTSTVVKMLDLAIQRDFCHREWPTYRFDPSYYRNIVSSSMHCLLNLVEVSYRGVEDKISMVNKSVDLAIVGRLFTTPAIHKVILNRYGVMTPLAKLVRTSYAFYDMLSNSRRIRLCKPVYSAYDIETSRITTAQDMFDQICLKLPDLSKICECHCHTSAASTMTQCVVMVTMAENEGEISQSMIQDIASLLACISETESADVPTSLKMVARRIAANDEVSDFLQMSPDEARVWLESHPDPVGDAFRTFLHRHGHRCVKEFDLRSLSWGMAPEGLVSTLQTMVRNPESYSSLKEELDLELVLDSTNQPIAGSKRRALKFILKLCGSSISSRENSKSMIIRTVNAFRKAYRTLGQLMVSECRLPDSDLIFYLLHREIQLLLETRSAKLVSKAIRRRKLMTQLEGIQFPEICFGVVQPENCNDENDVPDGVIESCIRGTPVCNGRATGTARVVTTLREATQIQNGDILVTFCTDVGWTPYFPLLAGVVTEIGGLISHGAVVAREYGLPCVVGVKGATKKLVSGETIFINGGEGFIQKVSK